MTHSNNDQREREANYFAMCLLMPEKLVRGWIAKYGITEWSLTDDDILKKMANDFGVSITLCALRLQDLGIWKKL